MSAPYREKPAATRRAHQLRGEFLARISNWLDLPLTVLAFVMLGLLVLELTVPLSPNWPARISQIQTAIWVIFVAAFLFEFALAPSKIAYLKQNWLTAIAVALPALRTLRVLRFARALRGLSLVRIITTLNRGARALDAVLQKGQFGYVLMLVVVISVTAAAGAYYFERGQPDANIQTWGDALWWAAAIITTINSPFETVTFEGRIIALLLRIFALAVSGYLTAIIAVYLLGGTEPAQLGENEPATEAPDEPAGAVPTHLDPAPSAPAEAELRQLRLEVARLHDLIERQASCGSGQTTAQSVAAPAIEAPALPTEEREPTPRRR